MQLLSFATTFVALWSCISSLRSSELRLQVSARKTECFFEEITRADAQVDVFTQVLRGGRLDIGLSIYNLESEEKILSASIQRDSDSLSLNLPTSHNVTGYKICLENSFSLLTQRLVQLTILVHQRKEYCESDTVTPGVGSDVSDELQVHSNLIQDLTSVRHRLTRVAKQLHNITNTQHYVRVLEARHRLQAEYNNRRVLMWSVLEMVVMIFAALVQVISTQRMLRIADWHNTT